MDKDTRDNLLIIFGFLFMLIIEMPLIYFFGWLAGWFTKVFIGDAVCSGLNMIFNTSFTPDLLPKMGGALAWIGSFFKSKNFSTNNN